MPARLREVTTGDSFDLAEFTLIGRSEGANIRLSDSGISRQHATIRREGEHYWLVDLGSANGSFVNDVVLGSARALRHGDRVRFGDSVLVFSHANSDEPNFNLMSDRTTIAKAAFTPYARETLTLLVGDIKGFTSLSNRLSAEQIADLMSEWYADCRKIMQECGGTIDKFIGDCVFAYWHGGDEMVRLKALRAAKALQSGETGSSSPTRAYLQEKHGISLECRVGLHVGVVAIGSMGKDISTALGDAVNVAFRIETLTRAAERSVLASRDFVNGLPLEGDHVESCGKHMLKGLARPMEIFALGQQ